MILNELKDVNSVIETLNRVTTGKNFYDDIFRNQYTNVFFFESWNIFSEETYLLFQKLLGSNTAYLVTQNFANYDYKQYIDFLDLGQLSNEEFNVAYKLNENVTFETIEEIQESANYDFLDSYIISELGDWCFFNNANLDLLALGFSKKNEQLIEKLYLDDNERITSLEKVFEYSKNGFKSEKHGELKTKLSSLYSHYFK